MTTTRSSKQDHILLIGWISPDDACYIIIHKSLDPLVVLAQLGLTPSTLTSLWWGGDTSRRFLSSTKLTMDISTYIQGYRRLNSNVCRFSLWFISHGNWMVWYLFIYIFMIHNNINIRIWIESLCYHWLTLFPANSLNHRCFWIYLQTYSPFNPILNWTPWKVSKGRVH